MTLAMQRPKLRLLITMLAAAIIVGGLVRLAVDDEVAEVMLPDPDAERAPLGPSNLAALTIDR
jgi:hypothetical protein